MEPPIDDIVHRFVFPPGGYPGWKLSTVLPGVYNHHDGTVHRFDGVPRIDTFRRLPDGGVELTVIEHPRRPA